MPRSESSCYSAIRLFQTVPEAFANCSMNRGHQILQMVSGKCADRTDRKLTSGKDYFPYVRKTHPKNLHVRRQLNGLVETAQEMKSPIFNVVKPGLYEFAPRVCIGDFLVPKKEQAHDPAKKWRFWGEMSAYCAYCAWGFRKTSLILSYLFAHVFQQATWRPRQRSMAQRSIIKQYNFRSIKPPLVYPPPKAPTSSNIGRYIEMRMPATTKPRSRTTTGSIKEESASSFAPSSRS